MKRNRTPQPVQARCPARRVPARGVSRLWALLLGALLPGRAAAQPPVGLPFSQLSRPPSQESGLGELLRDETLGARALAELVPAQSAALEALARQAIGGGIDYASLGLGWEHPKSRLEYRRSEGVSFAKRESRERQERSRLSLRALILRALDSTEADAAAALVSAFCDEIGVPEAAATATFHAVAAALAAELLLPLRALNEGIDVGRTPMTRTYSGQPVPKCELKRCVDAITATVLNGTFSNWRYNNAVGREQLRGLSEAQISLWRSASRTRHGALSVAEDAAGELGFFWATKIGGPSHGFDVEGQCLLPLLANARHKVVLVSDPQWAHYPAARAHLRLLWVHGASPPKAVLWLETVNGDFSLPRSLDQRPYQRAVLAHAIAKAEQMGVALSTEPYLLRDLPEAELRGGSVREVHDRLVLRPSNGVVEASDYLSRKHDWVQLEEETTPAVHRALFEPRPENPERALGTEDDARREL